MKNVYRPLVDFPVSDVACEILHTRNRKPNICLQSMQCADDNTANLQYLQHAKVACEICKLFTINFPVKPHVKHRWNECEVAGRILRSFTESIQVKFCEEAREILKPFTEHLHVKFRWNLKGSSMWNLIANESELRYEMKVEMCVKWLTSLCTLFTCFTMQNFTHMHTPVSDDCNPKENWSD